MEQIKSEINSWTHAPNGEPLGYIQPDQLKELWFHTGTVCNLSCPFCLEGSKPGDIRIQALTLEDVWPFIHEAVDLGVEQFSFTGGEPFVVPDFIDLLRLALAHRPCLVLTNGTEPLFNSLHEVRELKGLPHPLRFRVSIDYANEKRHDMGRGPGNFRRALDMMKILVNEGFAVSVARQREVDENIDAADNAFRHMLAENEITDEIPIISFPDFQLPNSESNDPLITENCMTTYHTEASRAKFMCAYSKMVVKKNGRVGVYACTLVDDDPDYDMGSTLTVSMKARVMLKHHRCNSCFACGASCSEPG